MERNKSEEIAKPSLPVGSIWAPRFERAENGRIYAGAPRAKRAPRDLLSRFCRIAEAEDGDATAISFARHWGTLGLCRHGIPAGHSPACNDTADSTDGYRTFALCLDALLRIGRELNAGRTGDEWDWELADSILYGSDFPPGDKALRGIFRKYLRDSRIEFQAMMRRLTTIARLQPRLRWDDKAWAIDFDCFRGSNLPALLTVQLMAEVGGNLMRKCRACPRWFQPVGRQVYCSACGIRAAWRDAARRQRTKR